MDARRVKLMSDYHAGWPLWTGREELLGPDTTDLSDGLVTDLRSWQELFEDQYHWDRGWRTQEAQARYARAAADLVHRLRRELGPAFEVTLDAWPVADPGLAAWLSHRA